MASYFSVPSIGGLYTAQTDATTAGAAFMAFIKKVQDFFSIGLPIYPDKYEEKGGNEIGSQILVGGVGNGTNNFLKNDAKSESSSVTGALVKVMDNVVVNPRTWNIHGYMGINVENSRVLQVASGLNIPSTFLNSFLAQFGRETLNSLMKKYLRYVSEARRPFKFTTAEGETLAALIKNYSLKNVPENLNWIEVDLEIQEFRFIALLSNNEQEMVGGVNGLYNSSADAAKQLSRSALKTIGIRVSR